MIAAPFPGNEVERLNALEEYNILDTLPEAEFDDITRIASYICGTPMSLITLLDHNRQWFKSRYGLDVPETPRKDAFCGYTILNPGNAFIVPDSSKDERFADNPLVTGVPHVNFYGGVPLVNPQGFVLGALCVLDTKPNNLSTGQIDALYALGRQIMVLLELKRTRNQLSGKQKELEEAYADLEKFAFMASHDLKSPLGNIVSLTYLVQDISGDALPAEGKEYLDLINTSAFHLSHLIDSILEYSKSSQLLVDKTESILLPKLCEYLGQLIMVPKGFKITHDAEKLSLSTSKVAITQILMNLVNNAIKYNDKAKGQVHISFTKQTGGCLFKVADNGAGIPIDSREKIFDLFERLKERDGKKEGTGVGLAVVKRLVEKIGGNISLESEPGKGTTFIFFVPGKVVLA